MERCVDSRSNAKASLIALRRRIRGTQFPFPLADGAEITIRFSFFSRPPQSPGISSPCSLERRWLSAAIIARPGNGQDLPLPINFAHLPVFDACIGNLVV